MCCIYILRQGLAVAVDHMIEYTRKGLDIVQGRRREEVEADEVRTLAVARALEILGEAARPLPAEIRSAPRRPMTTYM